MHSNSKKNQNKLVKIQTSILIVLFISFSILLLFIILQKNKLYQIERKIPRENNQNIARIDNSYQNVKKILDLSMANQGAEYFSHQEISAPDVHKNTISFVYFKSHDNKTIMPSKDEIIVVLKKSEEMRIKGQSLMKQAQENSDNEMAQKAANILVEADKQRSQEENFYTVEIAKDTSMPPIIMVQRGLSEWIKMMNKAQLLAEKHFGKQFRLVGVDRPTLGAPCIFIMQNSKGDSIFIDARSDKIFSTRTRFSSQNFPRTNSQLNVERMSRIQSQWQDFMRNGIKLNDFSLDGLIDKSKQTKR